MKKLFEEYVESADYKVSVFFKELKAQIMNWFDSGSLAAQGCELDGEIQITIYNPMEKFLIFNFTENLSEDESKDGNLFFRYRVVFLIRLDQMKGKENNSEHPDIIPAVGKNLDINKVLLKIHQFDFDNIEKGELVEEVDVEEIKEDFLIDKIGQLKDKSDNSDNDVDFKDNIYVK